MTISAEQKEKNRKYLRNKKLKHYSFVVFTFALIALFLLFQLPPKETKTIQATALKLSALQTDEGSKLLMLVELQNGKKVKARLLRKFPFVKGAQVTVTMKKSYLGFSTYSVLWNTKNQSNEIK